MEESAIRVLAAVRLFPPGGGAGAEYYLLEVLLALQRRGHSCAVWATTYPGADELDGIDLRGHSDYPADVVIGQIDGTANAKRLAQKRGVPWVHVAHSDRQFGHRPSLQVANSVHIAGVGERYSPVLVCRPHVPAARYQTKPGDMVTLVNLSRAKGGHVFYELARRMPERGFLGIVGAWDTQLPLGGLANLRVDANTADMRSVYQQTRVLLMPSESESWGRCAIEAAHSGIPTVCNATAGLREAMVDAALYAGTVDCYEETIRCLDDPAEYAAYGERARERAAALEVITGEDLDRLCIAVEGLCG